MSIGRVLSSSDGGWESRKDLNGQQQNEPFRLAEWILMMMIRVDRIVVINEN